MIFLITPFHAHLCWGLGQLVMGGVRCQRCSESSASAVHPADMASNAHREIQRHPLISNQFSTTAQPKSRQTFANGVAFQGAKQAGTLPPNFGANFGGIFGGAFRRVFRKIGGHVLQSAMWTMIAARHDGRVGDWPDLVL